MSSDCLKFHLGLHGQNLGKTGREQNKSQGKGGKKDGQNNQQSKKRKLSSEDSLSKEVNYLGKLEKITRSSVPHGFIERAKRVREEKVAKIQQDMEALLKTAKTRSKKTVHRVKSRTL